MKKFKFSLDKISSYKEQMLRKEKNELASLQRILIMHQDEKNELITKLENASKKFNEEKNFTTQSMAIHRNYTTGLNDQILKKLTDIHESEIEIQKQLKVVMLATQELNSYEKLEENQLKNYKKAEQKENENFIEEFVSYQTQTTVV